MLKSAARALTIFWLGLVVILLSAEDDALINKMILDFRDTTLGADLQFLQIDHLKIFLFFSGFSVAAWALAELACNARKFKHFFHTLAFTGTIVSLLGCAVLFQYVLLNL